MALIFEKTKHQEAYRCKSGHVMRKCQKHANFPVIDSMDFYGCCPECGSKEIEEVTGIWEREYTTIGGLFGWFKKLEKEQFVESILSFHHRRELKEKRDIGTTVHFKFALAQFVKTTGEGEGVIQILANEKAGNKYWVMFNNKSSWVWESELTLIDFLSVGFSDNKERKI